MTSSTNAATPDVVKRRSPSAGLRVLQHVVREPAVWFEELIRFVPGVTGLLARRMLWGGRAAARGKQLIIEPGVILEGHKNIHFGDNVMLFRSSRVYAQNGRCTFGNWVAVGSNTAINATDGGEVVIGNDVMIAANGFLHASNHEFAEPGTLIRLQGHRAGRIVVGNDVWIGANVTILPGVTIGDHSVIGAGSVVTRDIPPRSIAVGVPAKVVKER